jgi:type II secretion system protein C
VRITLRKAALAATLTIACWLIAHTINVYVSHALLSAPITEMSVPETSVSSLALNPDPVQMAQTILSSGLFVVPRNAPSLDPEADKAPAPPPPIEVTGKLKLLGTAIGEGLRPSAAIEHQSDHSQKLYFLEETIEGFGRLAIITRKGVTIRQGNREGFLPLAETALEPMPPNPVPTPVKPAQAKPPAPYTMIDRRQLRQNLSEVSKLLTDARAMPYYDLTNNGKLEGWQLIEIKPNSILDQLGIQQKDVMLRINGTPVVDPGTMLRLLQDLQHERIVKLDLIRGGERQTLTYEIR